MKNSISFEEWVLMHYTGRVMKDPPENFDPEKEMYVYHKGKQFGPIKKSDVPKEYI